MYLLDTNQRTAKSEANRKEGKRVRTMMQFSSVMSPLRAHRLALCFAHLAMENIPLCLAVWEKHGTRGSNVLVVDQVAG